ncbi:MAG TPA: hypothetical protein VGX23_30010 [Actinocrinis sp.]|nr:hypothetical protein [Actinocrinis sp.]
MDTNGAPSHDSGTPRIAPVIPIRPGVGPAPRRERRPGPARAARTGRTAADRLRSARSTTALRWSTALVCATLLALMWWDSRSDGYDGLPVNTLGQVLGDLIMMGIALPLVLPRRPREEPVECGLPAAELVEQLARATRRIQLLDAGSTLFPEPRGMGEAYRAVFGPGSGQSSGYGSSSGHGSGDGQSPGYDSGHGSGSSHGYGSVSGLGSGAEPGPWLGPCPDEKTLGRHRAHTAHRDHDHHDGPGSHPDAGHESGRAADRRADTDGPGKIARWFGARDHAEADPAREALATRAAILSALRSALARDVTVEVLLPRPDLMVPLDSLTGLPARTIEQDLADLRTEVPTGKLDVHHYRDAPGIVMARCDDQLWVSFPAPDPAAGAFPRPAAVAADDEEHADTGWPAVGGARREPGRATVRTVHLGGRGPSSAAERPVYLRFDCRARGARVVVLHFARLLAAAQADRFPAPAAGSDRDRARPDADPEPPGARLAFARPPDGRRASARAGAPTGPPPRPRSPGPAAAADPARPDLPSLLIVTAPPGPEPAGTGRPEPGLRWSLRADGARTHPHRDGE